MNKTVSVALLPPMLLALCAALALPAPAHAGEPAASVDAARSARAPEDRSQIERRLGSVATLIESSTAARQIEGSGNAQAAEKRVQARALHLAATQAYQADDLAGASRLLDAAAKSLFEGVRMAAPEQVTAEKNRRDFDARMESVKALLNAQKRIAAEKKLGAKGADTTARIEAQMRDAAALAAAGKLEQGKALLDQVYTTTRTSIEGMREGDTLVRSLQFANKEEEYHYEIDRNDTHRMLVKVLLDEKRASNPGLSGMVQKYLDQSAVLREQAEGQARQKEYEAAIKTLEDSTRELVRAIRGAGVYIPG